MPDPQQRKPIGSTGLQVTRLGLGTAPIGGLFSAVAGEEARTTVDAAWRLGLRFFDTAPFYGYGLAESRLGAALANRPRDAYVLASKVGRLLRPDQPRHPADFIAGQPMYQGAPPVSAVFDFSYDGVMRSLEESLARLGLDRIDILHIHDPDVPGTDEASRDGYFNQALAGAYRALADLRAQRVIRGVSVGMNQTAMLARFARAGQFDCFLVAGRYTLLDQTALDELLPLCMEKGIGVIIGGVYNSGILADPKPGARFDYKVAESRWLERARSLDEVCGFFGVPLKAAALQFPAAHPAVVSVLTGARTAAEVEENARLFSHPIPEELWQELTARHLIPDDVPLPGSRDG